MCVCVCEVDAFWNRVCVCTLIYYRKGIIGKTNLKLPFKNFDNHRHNSAFLYSESF